jgi:hypothetical protein
LLRPAHPNLVDVCPYRLLASFRSA